MSDLRYFGFSIKGKRSNNEDSYFADQIDENSFLFAVADGMGGAVAGEVASNTAIELLKGFIKSSLSENESIDLKSIIHESYIHVQEKIRDLIDSKPEIGGMGTTLSVLLIHKGRYVWANLGDSRIYKIEPGYISQITKDHTYIQDLLDKGENPDQEFRARYSNLITKCINGGIEKPDLFPVDSDSEILETEMAFLLCSDGLVLDKANDLNERLLNIFLSEADVASSTEAMVYDALENGSKDNITVVIAESGFIPRKPDKKKGSKGLIKTIKKILFPWRIYLFGLAGILAIVLIYFILNSDKLKQDRYPEPPVTQSNWEKQFTEQADAYTENKQVLHWQAYNGNEEVKCIQLDAWTSDYKYTYIVRDSANSGATRLTDFHPDLFRIHSGKDLNISISAILSEKEKIPGDTIIIRVN